MAAPVRLILCGDTVFLAGIKALLSPYSLDLVAVNSDHPDAAAYICALNPHAVLFDLSTAQSHFLVPLICGHPDMLLIGVDAGSDELLVLSPQRAHVTTVAELIKLLSR